jgi:hypothetical protein
MKTTWRGAVAALVVLAAIVAVVFANVVLLGFGDSRHDPVGSLSPRINLELGPAPVRQLVRPAREYQDD